MERLLDELLFSAPELSGQEIVVTRKYVEERLAGIVKNADLSRYIL
jgi:ATP-dependent HslUV protease ATP-binding subunit HslU